MKNINIRLKMALLLQSKESGFAIVIAVSLGLIMILVGLTMTLRSQGDQVISSSQKQTDEALAAAEKGIAFYRAFFNSSAVNRRLVGYSDCATGRRSTNPGATCNDPASTTDARNMSWSNLQNITSFASACDTGNFDNIKNKYASTAWKDANDPLDTDTNVRSSQQFRLVEYKPVRTSSTQTLIKQIGRLVVEGRMTPDNNADINKSISRLEVTIPVREGDILSTPVPGVWVSGSNDADGTGDNNIAGDILINNCNISSTNFATMQNNIQGNHAVRKTEMTIPSVPTIPTVRRIGTPPNNPPVSTNPLATNTDRPGHIPLSAISGNTTLTLPDETANYSTTPVKAPDSRFKMPTFAGLTNVYVYKVPSITGGNVTIRIKPNTKVILYLDGSISGNVSIICETRGSCNPMDTMIFENTSATPRPSNPQICINGQNTIEAFILAPNHTVGISGGGAAQATNGDANFVGAVWSKEWGTGSGCGSSATGNGVLAVKQVGTWENVPPSIRGQVSVQYPPEIDSAGTWNRVNRN